jgi:hypothetical protein
MTGDVEISSVAKMAASLSGRCSDSKGHSLPNISRNDRKYIKGHREYRWYPIQSGVVKISSVGHMIASRPGAAEAGAMEEVPRATPMYF